MKDSGINLDKYEFDETILNENAINYVKELKMEFFNKDDYCEVALRTTLLLLMTYLYKNYLNPAQKKNWMTLLKMQ